MKLNCLQCGHKFEGSISHDELGWHSTCPECGGSFDVDVPKGNIAMAFAEKVARDYIGKTMFSRDGSIKGTITGISYRRCAACGYSLCYLVTWEDGKKTKPCAGGIKCVDNGVLQIS